MRKNFSFLNKRCTNSAYELLNVIPSGICSTISGTSIHIFADNAKLWERGMIIKFIMPFICRLTWHDSSQPDKRRGGKHVARRRKIKRIATDKKIYADFIQFSSSQVISLMSHKNIKCNGILHYKRRKEESGTIKPFAEIVCKFWMFTWISFLVSVTEQAELDRIAIMSERGKEKTSSRAIKT